jgi:hypothetical protein
MRKFLRTSGLAAIALGAFALTAQAQAKQVGLVAGVNFATLNGSDISDGAGTRTGFIGGLFVAVPLGDGNWAIEPEVLYSMQGASYDNVDFTGDYKADYIKIPVLVKWSANPGGKGVYIFAGPSVGFNVSCNDSGTDNADNSTYDGTCEDEDNIKAKTTFSGDVGLGFSSGRVGLEGRYSFDWGDAFEITGTGSPGLDGTSLKAKNSVFSILVRLTK